LISINDNSLAHQNRFTFRFANIVEITQTIPRCVFQNYSILALFFRECCSFSFHHALIVVVVFNLDVPRLQPLVVRGRLDLEER
jgi:hypothetical protein